MSAGDVAKRLSYLRARKKEGTGSAADAAAAGRNGREKSSAPEKHFTLPGWKKVKECVYVREESVPVEYPERFGPGPLFTAETHADSLIFFDTETTGLSGGAGTVAFLIGVGKLESGRFTGTQVFLSDYPGEPDFLDYITALFPPDALCVSYNGRTFDSHLLMSRFALNRIPFIFPAQLDLLFTARRLWKERLTNCSLSTVEQEILGIFRHEDVPGALVPDIYFRFLREKTSQPDAAEELVPVFEHNFQDIVSLARLLVCFETMINNPSAADARDHFHLARLLLGRGSETQKEEGRRLLEGLTAGGDLRSGLLLAADYRRKKKWSDAGRIWEELWEAHLDYTAGVELAKYYEHRRRDYSRAASLTDTLLSGTSLTPRQRDALVHRRERLDRKIRSGASIG